MGRIVAIDFGQKRTGLAATDTLQLIANGLLTLPSHEVVAFLTDYVAKEAVDLFVVGQPKQLNNQPSDNMVHVASFVKHLGRVLPTIPIVYVDERFTSKIAQQVLIDAGVGKKKRQDKKRLDTISAVLILQSYLEKTKYNIR